MNPRNEDFFMQILQIRKFDYTLRALFPLMSHIAFLLVSLVTAFCLSLLVIPSGIALLRRFRIGKNIRSEGLVGKAEEFEKLHTKKGGTPTMGGIIMIAVMLIMVALSVIVQYYQPFGIDINHHLWNREETYLVIFTLVSVGLVGAVDDYLNVRGIGRTKGLSANIKMVSLIILGLLGAYWFFVKLGYSHIHLPFFGNITFGWLYIPIFIFVFIASANSVNITDGLDGLAGGLLLFQFLAYGAITYLRGLYVLSAFCFIISGILLAFLWFNVHPARVFMGDTGSLALGATLAIMAFMTDTLIAYVVMSGIFIAETLSVIIQIGSKKLRNGKKIFKIAPYHHHLEAIGWKEETIVMRLWLLGLVLAIVGVLLSFSV